MSCPHGMRIARVCGECKREWERNRIHSRPRKPRRSTAAQREANEVRKLRNASRFTVDRSADEALAQEAIALYHSEKAKAEERRIRKGGKSIEDMIRGVDARMTDEALERRARAKGRIDLSAVNVPHRRYHRGGEMQHWYGRDRE